MQKTNHGFIFSPSDIVRFANGPFAAWMERYYCEFPGAFERDETDPQKALLQKKGFEHEHEVLADLQKEFGSVCDLREVPRERLYEMTLKAMADGVPVIYQAELRCGEFRGYSDFLVKVPGKSRFGDYLYEPWD